MAYTAPFISKTARIIATSFRRSFVSSILNRINSDGPDVWRPTERSWPIDDAANFVSDLPKYALRHQSRYKNSQPQLRKGIETTKSVLLALVALLAFASSINAEDKSEEQAVRRVLADFAQGINRGDAKAFAALFTEHANFVVITGNYLKGRNEIVTYHAGLFSGDFQASHLDVTSVAVRFLRPDIAIARISTKGTENGGKQMRTSFPMFVLTKQGESWLIAAV
jgi:uncharacterized protein (TIGR02246 family)